LLALLLLAPIMAGCSGTADIFSSEILSKDAEWFSRSGRLFIRNIEAPPLSPNKPVTAEDLVSADGLCPGMAPPGPADANALTEGAAGAPTASTGTVALGHTECDVVRGIGAPDSVNLSSNARGDRVAVVNFSHGQRAGIYTFTSGRLSSIERGAEPVAPPKTAKPKAKKKPAAT
jgi:PPE-repeat protein